MDLRLPIGLLFGSIGVILTATGLVTGTRVLDVNINLVWGVVLMVFGAGALALARRAASRPYSQRAGRVPPGPS